MEKQINSCKIVFPFSIALDGYCAQNEEKKQNNENNKIKQ